MAKNKAPFDLEGAEYSLGSMAYRTNDQGEKKDVRHDFRIVLSDGTIFGKKWPRYQWSKWINNPDYNQHYTFSSPGHYRKCNDRYAAILDQAWHRHGPKGETS